MNSNHTIQIWAALKAKKAELLKAMGNREDIQIEGREPDHLDEALASSARLLAVDAVNRNMALLRRVEAAMLRFFNGNFGTCEDCEDPIPLARLSVVPWAERCVGCQEEKERK